MRSPVPNRQCEHAAQSGDEPLLPSMPAVDDNFGIAAAAEGVSEILKFSTDLPKVVYFAVIGDPDAPVHACHRLVSSRRQVDDGQSRMSQTRSTVCPNAFVIWTAVAQSRDHCPEPRFARSTRQGDLAQDVTANAAHSRAG